MLGCVGPLACCGLVCALSTLVLCFNPSTNPATPSFCKCAQPYNPDRFMAMCDGCEEWHHPECIAASQKVRGHSSVN